MMDADRQLQVVGVPQFLEDQLGQPARVAKRRCVVLCVSISAITCGDGIFARMARPGDAAFGEQDRDDRAARRDRLAPKRQRCARPAAPASGDRPSGIGHRRRQRHPPQPAGRARCSRESDEAEQIAALAGGKGVDFVDHHRLEPREHLEAVRIGEQQAEAFGRGQQNLRRSHPLPRLAVGRRVAGPRLDPDIEAHLVKRAEQIALHIDRQRLQRRNIERVQAFSRVSRSDRRAWQKPRQRLARAGGRDEQGVLALPAPRRASQADSGGASSLSGQTTAKEGRGASSPVVHYGVFRFCSRNESSCCRYSGVSTAETALCPWPGAIQMRAGTGKAAASALVSATGV